MWFSCRGRHMYNFVWGGPPNFLFFLVYYFFHKSTTCKKYCWKCRMIKKPARMAHSHETLKFQCNHVSWCFAADMQESDVSAASPAVNHDKYIIRLWESQQSRQWGGCSGVLVHNITVYWVFTLNVQYLKSGLMGPGTSWPQPEWSPYQPGGCMAHLFHKTLQWIK